jgi:hypothetical protein
VAFLLHLGFVFASDEGSATIGVVVAKTKIEQENAEEGAIGGINNIAAIKLDAGIFI